MHYKEVISVKFAEMVYNGLWYNPLRKALTAFIDETQKTVTGDVKVKLYKGNVIYAGATSPYSLYSESVATFGAGGIYDQKDAGGFINCFALPTTVRALADQELQEKTGLSFPSVE